MADLNPTNTHSRTITAFFDTRQAAERAVEDLAGIGVAREQARITEGADPSATHEATSEPAGKGFWEELKGLFLPEEDRHSYAEGLRRGGYLLSAQVSDAHYDKALEVLDHEGAVDMDEREQNWRASGWTNTGADTAGMMGAASGLGAAAVAPVPLETWGTERATGAEARASMAPSAQLDAERATTAPASSVGSTPAVNAGRTERAMGAAPASANFAAPTARTDVGQEEVIPIYEETANVGKRDVNHGRVRLRSYVVETPFTEQVNLRSEQVQVERRPVSRPVVDAGAAFKDRVIEVEEHAEEAVIGKETRIKEEVSLRKTVENQSQTVSEKLRRTEVEVQDERTGGALGHASTSAHAGRIADGMDVIASDGEKIGTVDHLDGENIKLAKTTSPDGQHHFVPLAWVDYVDTHVHLGKPVAEAKAAW